MPENDATLRRVEFAAAKRRRGTASRALCLRSFGASDKQVPATYPHARPGYYGLSEDCHKSPRSLPPAESAKSSASQDAPGIPSSARDHSLAPWLTTHIAWEVPRLRGIQYMRRGLSQELRKFCCINFVDSGLSPQDRMGRFNPAPEHQVFQTFHDKVTRHKEGSAFQLGLQ
jgi:hypothetical protein